MITSDGRDSCDREVPKDKHPMYKILIQRIGYPLKRAGVMGKALRTKAKVLYLSCNYDFMSEN
ncbi:hypothetical protein H9X97_04545 [Klebsiella aerogenes]|nr:hypothetical protein [Klebsiella aerogenes]MCB4372574.1 hypothetical protein [Klebsiella aerogenes]